MSAPTTAPAVERSAQESIDEKSVEAKREERKVVEDILEEGSVDAVYQAKAHVLNQAIQDIGMGRYQWWLFFVTGFGWFADNLFPVVSGLIMPPLLKEFPGNKAPFFKLAQNIGLLLGAFIWGLGSDVWGRRVSFNITFLIIGVFATAAGGAHSFITIAALASVWSIGVGGNLPVDSSIFIEALPGTHQYLLTILSIWWAFGQLFGAVVAWPLIANFCCEQTAETCSYDENKGWRYFIFTMGGLMLLLWGIRFFVFKLHESPKYLMGRGKDAEAVANVHLIAAFNGRTTNLTVEDLQKAAIGAGENGGSIDEKGKGEMTTSAMAVMARSLRKFDASHVKALFRTRRLAWSTSLTILIWGLIGLAFPLYGAYLVIFLSQRGADFGDGSLYTTYRNEVIISVIGVPGAIIGGILVEVPLLGRKGTLAISTVLTGIFLLASTTARTSDALLGWNCGYSFTSNVMYGVLYGYTPEIFPTKDRGTGTGLAATANRIFGIMSPIIALKADLSTPAPIYTSGALFIAAGFLVLLLPYEPRGKSSL